MTRLAHLEFLSALVWSFCEVLAGARSRGVSVIPRAVDTTQRSGQPVHVLIINLVKQRLSVCINRLPAGISQLLVLINARYFVLT